MKSLLFNPEKRFDSSPNKLIPINPSYSMKEQEYAFGRLAKTNIFIGENNSGKSRFLRSLFLNNFYAIDKDDIERFYQSLKKDLSYDQKREFETINLNDRFNYLYEKLGELRSYYSNVANGFFASLQDCSSLISHSNKYYFSAIRGVKDYRYIINKKLNEFIKSEKSIQNTDPIYHYLSLLNLKDEGLPSFDIYREMISHEYFASARSSSLNILTGGQLYNTIKAMLLGDAEERKNIMDFQDFLCEKFFAEYENVQLIPKEAEKVLYIKIGDDERPIYDWGDGTQQLIIILFSLFVHKDEKDRMFFIEEPEIYLHPGMLRRFIEVINSDVFPYHQYFITTHSNAILDISADTNVNMSIFKFKKKRDLASSEPQFEIEQCNNGDASLLNELGVRNSSVFLTNCSIWVEGITDRLYLKHYVAGYLEGYKRNSRSTYAKYLSIELQKKLIAKGYGYHIISLS